MSPRKKATIAFVILFVLFLFVTGWADSDPTEGKSIGQSYGFSTGDDDFSSKAGVRRNCVLVEIATGTW